MTTGQAPSTPQPAPTSFALVAYPTVQELAKMLNKTHMGVEIVETIDLTETGDPSRILHEGHTDRDLIHAIDLTRDDQPERSSEMPVSMDLTEAADRIQVRRDQTVTLRRMSVDLTGVIDLTQDRPAQKLDDRHMSMDLTNAIDLTQDHRSSRELYETLDAMDLSDTVDLTEEDSVDGNADVMPGIAFPNRKEYYRGFRSEALRQNPSPDRSLSRWSDQSKSSEQTSTTDMFMDNAARDSISSEATKLWTRHCEELDFYHLDIEDTMLTPGMDVELKNGNVLRIKYILSVKVLQSTRISLKGLVFLKHASRQKYGLRNPDDEDFSDFLPEYPHEVCLSLRCLGDDTRDVVEQSLKEFPVSDFVGVAQVKLTNRDYPELNTLACSNGVANPNQSAIHPLICRWKAIRGYPSSRHKIWTKTYITRALIRLREPECDPGCAVSDLKLMESFRMDTIRGGSKIGMHREEQGRRDWERDRAREAGVPYSLDETSPNCPIDLDTPPPSPTSEDSETGLCDDFEPLVLDDSEISTSVDGYKPDTMWETTKTSRGSLINTHIQRYTFGDIFCGCGGVSRAAVLAGLCPIYAVDSDRDMCNSYRRNNPSTRIANIDAKAFAYRRCYDKRVDILHMSNPCQPFSRAHTTMGQNDAMNREVIHIFEEMLRQARPRIVTIENADGLMVLDTNWEYLKAVALQFTVMGFSIEFRVVNFADFGLCQQRKRIIINASCPGQRLPGYPKPTHGKNPWETDLLPWNGIGKAIADIPDGWLNHDLKDMKIFQSGQEYSSNRMCRTLMVNNSELLHPCGFRKFTIRELANIQTFPLYHELGKDQKYGVMQKQMGNAVPPVPFSKHLKHIEKVLLEDDGMLDSDGNRRPIPWRESSLPRKNRHTTSIRRRLIENQNRVHRAQRASLENASRRRSSGLSSDISPTRFSDQSSGQLPGSSPEPYTDTVIIPSFSHPDAIIID